MSKMSQLHAELSQSAAELGFENLQQAEEAGFVPNWNTGHLEKKGWEDEAHESLMEAKEEILNTIDFVIARAPEHREKLRRVQKFIQEEVK